MKINVSDAFADLASMDKIQSMIKGTTNIFSVMAGNPVKPISLNTGAVTDQQWKPNTTVAAIIERNGKFMMIEEFSRGQLVINQPAGHLEYGESLLDAIIREVREETAWGFIPESMVGLYMYPSPASDITYLRICFTGDCHDHRPEQPLDDGIQRVLWLGIDELHQQYDRLRSPMVLSSIEDYLAGNRVPLDYLKYQLQD